MNEEELKGRIRNAIILLEDGHSMNIGDLTLSSENKFSLEVNGWTNCNYLENITKQSALAELNEIKELFLKMLTVSNELQNFIINRKIQYSLGFDYGMGGVEICKEKDNQIVWLFNFKN